MDRLITNARLAALVATVLAATFAVVAWNDPGQVRQGPGHVDSSAWLPSVPFGTVQLVDGTLAADQGAVNPRAVVVARPEQDFDVVQYGAHALVLNHDDGTIRRVDGGLEQASLRVQPFEDANPGSASADPDAAVFAERGADTVWVYSGLARQVRRVDPVTLDLLGDAVSVAGSPDAAVVGGDGSLWAYDVESGEMKVVEATLEAGRDRVQSFAVAAAGTRYAVRLVGSHPVMIDLSDPTLSVYDGIDELRQSCDLEIADGADVLVGHGGLGATVAAVVDTAVARLYVFDVESTSCEHWQVAVGRPGDRIGTPVESDGHVYVPNLTDGRIYVVDLSSPDSGADTTDPVLLDAAEVQLIAEDGQVYFNDPTSAQAGVLLEQLGVESFEKFTSGDGPIIGFEDDGEDPVPAEPAPEDPQAEQGTPSDEPSPDEPIEEGEEESEATDAGGDQPDPDPQPDTTPDPAPQPDTTPDPAPQPDTTPDPQPDPDPDPDPTPDPDPQPEPERIVCVPSASTVQVGDEVIFTWVAQPEDDSVTPASALWTFGDGSDPAAGRQVTHTFDQAATYPVTIEVVADDGTEYEDTCQIDVTDAPVPIQVDIVVVNPNPYTNQDITFQAAVNVDTITSYSWSFDGGSPSEASGAAAASSWASAGSYVVTLVVSDGERDETATATVVIEDEPVTTPAPQIALSGSDRTPIGATANVTLSTIAGSWESVSWAVTAPPSGNAPDTSGVVGTSLAFAVDAVGPWTVTAVVTDSEGRTDEASWTVMGYIEPSFSIIAPAAATVGETVRIVATGSGDPDTFRWNVDGQSYEGPLANPIDHTFTIERTATISLEVVVDGIAYPAPSVTIEISASTISVPDVRGMDATAAQGVLSGAGLVPALATPQCSAAAADGAVLSQDPGPGASVLGGATVTITPNDRSLGWTAPGYVGQAHDPGGAHGDTTYGTTPVTDPGDVGRVLAQSPTAGTFSCSPQTIHLTVGSPGQASITCSGGTESASCTTATEMASISWGDGQSGGGLSHSYATAGVYTVSYTDVFGASAQTTVAAQPAASFTCSNPDGGSGSSNSTCTVTNPNPAYAYSWIATGSGDWAGRSVPGSGATWFGGFAFGWPGDVTVAVTIVLTVSGPDGTSAQASMVRQWTGCG